MEIGQGERKICSTKIIKYDFKFCTERHGNITITHSNVLKRRLFWGFLRLKFILYTIQKRLLTKVCDLLDCKPGNGNTKQISCFANINNTGKRLKFFIRFVGGNKHPRYHEKTEVGRLKNKNIEANEWEQSGNSTVLPKLEERGLLNFHVLHESSTLALDEQSSSEDSGSSSDNSARVSRENSASTCVPWNLE